MDSEGFREEVRSKLLTKLDKVLDAEGEIDFDKARQVDPTLADVLDTFAESKSSRTDPRYSAKLISQAIEARAKSMALALALEKLEEELGIKTSADDSSESKPEN